MAEAAPFPTPFPVTKGEPPVHWDCPLDCMRTRNKLSNALSHWDWGFLLQLLSHTSPYTSYSKQKLRSDKHFFPLSRIIRQDEETVSSSFPSHGTATNWFAKLWFPSLYSSSALCPFLRRMLWKKQERFKEPFLILSFDFNRYAHHFQ